jgi:transcriptional regulator with XRE-family HTH domain
MKTDRHPALIALGQQIRRIREEKGYSQEGFAAEAGIGRSYYGGVERGDHNITMLNLMRITAALKVEIAELFPKAEVVEDMLDRPTDAATDEE